MRYLTTQEVARHCQVSSVTVGKWIDSGHLRGHRTPGGHRRVARTDLVTFLRARHMPVPSDLQASGQPPLVVVADGEASFREEVGRRLSGRVPGAVVEEAASGVQALLKVGQMRPALVILDLELSDVNGSEVCRQLQDAHGLERTWVLAVTRKPASAPPPGATAIVQRSLGADAVVAAAAHALQSAGGTPAPD